QIGSQLGVRRHLDVETHLRLGVLALCFGPLFLLLRLVLLDVVLRAIVVFRPNAALTAAGAARAGRVVGRAGLDRFRRVGFRGDGHLLHAVVAFGPAVVVDVVVVVAGGGDRGLEEIVIGLLQA